jgi:hypothetical protein
MRERAASRQENALYSRIADRICASRVQRRRNTR